MNKTEWAIVEQFSKLLSQVDEPTIAWFSGWLCADGCIMVTDRRGRPRIKFTICDLDPLEKMSSIFGNKVSKPQKPTGYGSLPRYYWQLSGVRAALLLERCLPWLSDRYMQKAISAIQYKPLPNTGKKITPEQAAEIKRELQLNQWGAGKTLAARYGITDGMISAIKHGRAWV